jgi:hypothetical protein
VTTLDPLDMPLLRKALEAPASSLYTPAAGLAPEYETVELLSAQFPALSLEELLKKLDSEARLDGRYFLCKQEQLLETARVLRWVSGMGFWGVGAVSRSGCGCSSWVSRGCRLGACAYRRWVSRGCRLGCVWVQQMGECGLWIRLHVGAADGHVWAREWGV